MTISIKKMKEMEANATTGPWKARKNIHWDRYMDPRREVIAEVDGYTMVLFYNGIGTSMTNKQVDNDVAFVSAAREFIPWAIAEIERLREELEETKETIGEDMRAIYDN